MRSHRLAVRTSDSHSGNTGSIPVGTAKKYNPPTGGFYFLSLSPGIEPRGSCAKLTEAAIWLLPSYEPKGARRKAVGIYIPVGTAKCLNHRFLRTVKVIF